MWEYDLKRYAVCYDYGMPLAPYELTPKLYYVSEIYY